MPRKPKQLILEREEQENISNSDFRLHFDYSDSEYAEEHYGYYRPNTKNGRLKTQANYVILGTKKSLSTNGCKES